MSRGVILFALVISIAMGWGAYVYLKKDVREVLEVLVAVDNIQERQAIAPQMFIKKTVPKELFLNTMVTKIDPSFAYYARHPLMRGEILYQSALGRVEEEPELSYMIDRTQGVVTLGVTDVSGVSGILKPGDFVDVYVTYSKGQLEGLPKESKVESITKRVVSGCKVVACGAEVLSPVGGQNTAWNKFNRPRVPSSQKRVTLAVSDADMERIIYAQTNGKIHLALKIDGQEGPDRLRGFSNKDVVSEMFVQKQLHTIERIRGDKSELVQVEK